MPGLADIIGNAAQGAIDPTYGAQLHRQRFEAGQQSQRLGHEQKQELADRIAKQAEFYDGVGSPVGRQMHANAAKVLALPDDVNLPANLAKFETEHGGLVKQGETQLAQNHAGMGAGPIKPVAPAPAPPNAMNSGVFSPFIGAGAKEAAPLPGAAAQSNANPLTSPPPSQGGPASGQAGFPGPDASGPTPAPSVQPVAPVAPAPAPAPAPLGGALPNFQAAVDEFNSTGYMSPAIRAMIPGNAALTTGRQRLPYVQQIMDELGPMTDANGLPDMGKLMRAQAQLSALGIEGSNMAPLLMQMLQPQAETGATTWGMLSEPDKEIFRTAHPEIDLSQMDPRTPVRKVVNKITRRTLTIEPQSQIIHYAYGPHGELIPVESRTGEALPPVAGANGGPAPINSAFVPQSSTSVLNVPGQLPQTTTATRQRGTPVGAGAGGAIRPVAASSGGPRPSGPSGPNLSAATDNSVIATNYRDWIAGKATLSDKEQTAARQYAAQHNLPTPDLLSASGQKAVAQLQPILAEINHARELIRARKLDTMSETDSKLALGQAYAKYKYLRTDDPLAKAISDLSFDSLRSVGQALQGTGSRAYPIFQRGLEHTPVIGINSDSGKLMLDKLDGMERRVRESIEAAMTETKSGIVPPVGTSASPSAIPSVRPGAPSDPLGIR